MNMCDTPRSNSQQQQMNVLANEYVKQRKIQNGTNRKSFSEYYQNRSKSFSIRPKYQADFIDQQFIDVIDSKTPTKRIGNFIKRKVPSNKIKTEPVYNQLDENANKVFSKTFQKERKKELCKIQSSQQLKEKLMKKMGFRKKKVPTFFLIQREEIFGFQKQYKELFRKYNSKKLRPKTKIHPFCSIYDQQAQKVLKYQSLQKKKVSYKPFGEIDYSAHY